MTPWPDDLKRVLPFRLGRWANHVCGVAMALQVDALLLLAIMERESRGGDACQPKGTHERGTGDGGNGLGLMQIDGRYHATFKAALGPDGLPLWQDPTANIFYGATLFRMNLGIFKAEDAAVTAYNASVKRVRAALLTVPAGVSSTARLAALDSVTTGKNYTSDVLSTRARFQKALTQGGNNVS